MHRRRYACVFVVACACVFTNDLDRLSYVPVHDGMHVSVAHACMLNAHLFASIFSYVSMNERMQKRNICCGTHMETHALVASVNRDTRIGSFVHTYMLAHLHNFYVHMCVHAQTRTP